MTSTGIQENLYSRTRLLLDTFDTLLAGDRVFVGCNLDEFALAGLLGPMDSVCLLGLGFGGAVRPLLSTAPTARITAVDVDVRTAAACGAMFRSHFPGLEPDVAVADAGDYLRDTRRTFDAICVDLYTASGYAPSAFEPDLWRRVRDRLRPGGVVLVNAWGLPHQLDPLTGDSPQRAVAAVLAEWWPEIRALPNRRNLTLVCSEERRVPSSPELGGLRAVDRTYLRLLRPRFDLAERVADVGSAGVAPANLGTRSHMDAEMNRRWEGLAARFREAGDHVGFDHAESTPHRCVRNPPVARAITRRLLDVGSNAARFIPIAAAAAAFGNDQRVGWFGEWLVEDADELMSIAPRWMLETALPQAMAMMMCPMAPAWSWSDGLREAIDRIVDSCAGGTAGSIGARPTEVHRDGLFV